MRDPNVRKLPRQGIQCEYRSRELLMLCILTPPSPAAFLFPPPDSTISRQVPALTSFLPPAPCCVFDRTAVDSHALRRFIFLARSRTAFPACASRGHGRVLMHGRCSWQHIRTVSMSCKSVPMSAHLCLLATPAVSSSEDTATSTVCVRPLRPTSSSTRHRNTLLIHPRHERGLSAARSQVALRVL